jgi:hypothetical protein
LPPTREARVRFPAATCRSRGPLVKDEDDLGQVSSMSELPYQVCSILLSSVLSRSEAKFIRLAYRFSIDFSLLGIAYGVLDFILATTNI